MDKQWCQVCGNEFYSMFEHHLCRSCVTEAKRLKKEGRDGRHKDKND